MVSRRLLSYFQLAWVTRPSLAEGLEEKPVKIAAYLITVPYFARHVKTSRPLDYSTMRRPLDEQRLFLGVK